MGGVVHMKETKTLQGGSTANKNGRVLEDLVRSVLKTHNYTEMPYIDWVSCGSPRNTLVLRVPYTTIYNTKGYTEFLIATNTIKIRLECKWQQAAGSVDEKYPYLFENMLHVDENFIIILLSGGGYKKQAKEWLSNSCNTCEKKTIKLFNTEEFTVWANKNLPKL